MFINSVSSSPVLFDMIIESSEFVSNFAFDLSNGIQCPINSLCEVTGSNANAGSTSGGGAMWISLANVSHVEVHTQTH